MPPAVVELHPFTVARDSWELLLVRARQIGATAILAALSPMAATPAPAEEADAEGAGERDGVAFVTLCARLGLQVIVGIDRPAAGSTDIDPEQALGGLPLAGLRALQAPAGPIIGIRIDEKNRVDAGWLRDEGWIVPLMRSDAPAWLPATLVRLIHDEPGPAAQNMHLPPVRSDGGARPGFWRTKMLWMLIAAAGDDAPVAMPLAEPARDTHENRSAWADDEMIDLTLRHGLVYSYLHIANRRASPYSGLLAYRAQDGDVLHIHAGIGAGRPGLVMLESDEVLGLAFDGDASEGGWLARGLSTSVVFSGGAGGVAPCGAGGLVLVAPQSGRFQMRRGQGWADIACFRLLLNGRLLTASLQVDTTHLLVPYVAEDEHGQTDMYLVLRGDAELPNPLRAYLATLLAGRAAACKHAAALLAPVEGMGDALEWLGGVAAQLASDQDHLDTLADYDAAWRAADLATGDVLRALNAEYRGLSLGALDHAGLRRAERIMRSMRGIVFMYEAG
jgi:hypothetical protein